MGLLLTVELVAAVLEGTENLGTEAVAGFSLGMLAWLRSSSQDPIVAARLANLPLLPTGVSEETVGTGAGGTSA